MLISHAEMETPQNNKFSGAAPLLGSVASKPKLQVLKKIITAANPIRPLSASVFTKRLCACGVGLKYASESKTLSFAASHSVSFASEISMKFPFPTPKSGLALHAAIPRAHILSRYASVLND